MYINIIQNQSYTLIKLTYKGNFHFYIPSKSIEKNIKKTLYMYRTPKKTIDEIIMQLRKKWSEHSER